MRRWFTPLLNEAGAPAGGNPPVMQGGPGDSPAGAPPAAPPATPPVDNTAIPEPAAAPPKPPPQADTRAIDEAAAARAASRPPAQAPAKPVEPSIGEMIFEDADKAVAQIEERLERRLEERDQRKAGQAAFWDRFYVENPDLRGAERVVQSEFREGFEGFRTLSPDACRKELAKKVRETVDSVMQSRGMKVTEMTPGGSQGLGASGPTVPKSPKPAEEPAMNFVEQAKRLQKWR